ncbi:unnamed protein product [Fusarium graminearum]|uniref:Trichothecene 3-O-acetyltransferase-like N-terminal domain-containing protein n=1 Tax=Gibberella zeae TaxID=5518 RepID=A0A679PAV8_GIBZA|nr:unnamed protein product [Fusarium graminearum]CAG2007342.1 unnamed protein product [Fusarium graminearum]CAG2011823.1 unnamed protein product [Fusarium graminearum]CZS83334.1 unnamed protein product [Fusarium graminearum]
MSPNAISTGTQAKQDDYLVGLEQYGLQQPSAQQKLTPLDMNIPRLYGIRLVLCFPLTSGADKFQIYENLKKGLGHTVTSIPWIAEVIGPEEGQDPKAGRVQIVDSPIGYKFPRAMSAISSLKEKSFPLSEFSTAQLGPIDVMPQAQASFVDGGLLLTVGVYHPVCNAAALDALLSAWSYNNRSGKDDRRSMKLQGKG